MPYTVVWHTVTVNLVFSPLVFYWYGGFLMLRKEMWGFNVFLERPQLKILKYFLQLDQY